MYAIWKLRNDVRFGSSIDVASTVKFMENWIKDMERKHERKSEKINTPRKHVGWIPPKPE